MFYTCPVCGFDQLDLPPEYFNICPSCGIEFECDDVDKTHQELREIWIENGMQWWSLEETPPINWNPAQQLAHLIARNSAIKNDKPIIEHYFNHKNYKICYSSC